MNKPIFITGARGFIGKHVLKALEDKKYTLYCLSRNPPFEPVENIIWLQGDLEQIKNHEQILNQCKIIIHLAGETGDSEKMKKTNVEGLKNLLNMIDINPNKGFLHLSSAGVYGIRETNEKIISETSGHHPSDKYEETKIQAEEYLQSFSIQNNLRYTILRPTNVFGEFDKHKKLLNLCKALQKNRFLVLKRNAIVNYVYAGDIASVIKKIVEYDDFKNEIYNINSPAHILNFINLLKKDLNINSKTPQLPAFLRPVVFLASKIFDMLPPRFHLIDSIKYAELTNTKIILNKKAEDHFGIIGDAGFKKGLNNLVNYYREQNWL